MFETLLRGVLYALAQAAWFLLMFLGGQSNPPFGLLRGRRGLSAEILKTRRITYKTQDHFCALRIPHPRFQVVVNHWSVLISFLWGLGLINSLFTQRGLASFVALAPQSPRCSLLGQQEH